MYNVKNSKYYVRKFKDKLSVLKFIVGNVVRFFFGGFSDISV